MIPTLVSEEFLDKEGIKEEGSHEELLKNKGIYYRLWNQIPINLNA